MATYINGGFLQIFNSSNNFAVGGTVETYVSDTSTHRTTYPTLADAIAETNPNEWPVELGARGEAVIAINGPTDIIIKDSDGNVLLEVPGLDQLLADVLDENGNTLLHYSPAANAVNYLSIANSSTGNPLVVSASGADTNIVLSIKSKGDGALGLNAGTSGTVIINNESSGEITLDSDTSVTEDLTVLGDVGIAGGLGVEGSATIEVDLAVDGNITTSSSSAISFLPAGSIILFSAVTPPSGWLLLDGSAVSRTTYATLFALFGTGYGAGDSSTTFNLPNLQRRVPVGVGGSGTATLGNTMASVGGVEDNTLLYANLPQVIGGTISTTGVGTGATNVLRTLTITNEGSATPTPVNNIQPSIVLAYIIKAF